MAAARRWPVGLPSPGPPWSDIADRAAFKRAATAPDYFTADTPTAVLVRQVLGAIAEFEKISLVAKLRAARERKKAETGKCGGRQSHAEARPEVVALVRQLRRRRPKGGQRSLREISAELARLGHLNERGVPYAAMSIKAML
jgi:DNA invertase Pin-like site-specific DNA recombinase